MKNYDIVTPSKSIPEFRAGNKLCVEIIIRDEKRADTEAAKERKQLFEGICLARHNNGMSSTFIVRKTSFGCEVERGFLLHSPNINIQVISRGKVRRAKIFYVRGKFGKASRIKQEFNTPSKEKISNDLAREQAAKELG